MHTSVRPAVVYFGGGQLTSDGELDERTLYRFEEVLRVGSNFKQEGCPYVYIFTAGRLPNQGGQRPCDLLRLRALQVDPHCRAVIVPEADMDLVSDFEKGNYLRERARGVYGEIITIN